MNADLNVPPSLNTEKSPAGIRKVRFLLRVIGVISLVVMATFLGVFLNQKIFPTPMPVSDNQLEENIYQALASATPPAAFSSHVYQFVLPSLVFIQTQDENQAEVDGIGVGSGVVVNSNGDILTALHVVAEATEIRVVFADGSQTAAEIIASEPEKDIALLRPHQLPGLIVPATLGNLNVMQVGDEAYAIGNPLGLVASMSAGVISGFDRSIPLNDGLKLDGLIQFDTAVNPGNSGGPLLNRHGQVIGIVTALADPSEQGFFIGIGFAVPIGSAVAVGGGGPSY